MHEKAPEPSTIHCRINKHSFTEKTHSIPFSRGQRPHPAVAVKKNSVDLVKEKRTSQGRERGPSAFMMWGIPSSYTSQLEEKSKLVNISAERQNVVKITDKHGFSPIVFLPFLQLLLSTVPPQKVGVFKDSQGLSEVWKA